MTTDKNFLTQSSLSDFRNCRAKYFWRYIKNLRSEEQPTSLWFGGIIHDALEVWHATRNLENVFTVLDASFDWQNDDREDDSRLLARAIMKGYAERYTEEKFEISKLEFPFDLDIKNPETTGTSQTYRITGKADALVIQDGEYWLLEHKTASQIDKNYLERLWGDFQIAFYCYALERALNIKIVGVIYNILAKSRLKRKLGESDFEYHERREATVGTTAMKQKENETDEDFKIRHAEACAKNLQTKLDKMQQKETETDESYSARLDEWYQNPEVLMRETIIMSRDRFDEVADEIWELSKALLQARRRGFYYKNNAFCYMYGRQCLYYSLCAAGDRWINVAENLFKEIEPHGEVDRKNRWLKKTEGGNYEFTDTENKTKIPPF